MTEIIDIYEPTRPDLLDDDFWSTFYIAGNDEFILSDGLYYMDLLINGENVGTIATLIEGGKASISSEEFRYYIEGNVIEEVLERIFADNSKYIPIEYLSQISIPAVLDSNNYTISITKIDPTSGYTRLPDNNVKVYLSALTEDGEDQVMAPTLISNIITAGNTGTLTFDSGKTSYLTHVHTSADTTNTTKYRLRMWVDSNTDASSWTSATKYEYKLKIGVSGNLTA